MPQEFVQIFNGSSITLMAIADSLNKIGINPIIKNPSELARLAGFASLSSDQTLWVHIDEKKRALEAIKSLEF